MSRVWYQDERRPPCLSALRGLPGGRHGVRNVATSARQLPPREIEPERRSVTEPPDGDEPPTADTSIFDTDISELFPKRARFGVIDLLLIAGTGRVASVVRLNR
jgi:hypothetical protein